MKKEDNNTVFLALVRAGLWAYDQFQVSQDSQARMSDQSSSASFKFFDERSGKAERRESVDWEEVYRLACEQSVLGLVLAGLERFRLQYQSFKIPKVMLLQWIGEVQVLEQQNKAMNYFIGIIAEKLKAAGISCVLIKGQGIAQCYERPLWRAAGDVDLLLDDENFEKAKSFLTPLALPGSIKDVNDVKEYCLTIDLWAVELHGSLRCRLSSRMERSLDAIQEKICKGEVRIWENDGQAVPLPSVDNDVFVIFTHIIKHFFKGGIGLRQFCDWCRLMWTNKDSVDIALLEQRLHEMAILTEWKAFAAFAVDYLGMPFEAIPFYDDSKKWSRKAERILADILREGNFGHNRNYSYYQKYPFIICKIISLWNHFKDTAKHSLIFPIDSWRVFFRVLHRGVDIAVQGNVSIR